MNRCSAAILFPALWLMLLLLPAPARAQTASITGTATDVTGAVQPNVQVTAIHLATNSRRSAETDQAGTFRLPALEPGTYDIRVEKHSFKTLLFSSVRLTVDQVLTLDVRLEPSAIIAEVTVEGGTIAPIDLNDAQIGNVVSATQISSLPLILRDTYRLVLLSPGVIDSNSLFGGFSVNGSRERNNNFLLDGTDNNDADVPGFPGGLTRLNPDNTEEFRVISSNYLPEFGRNTGAVVDIVTRKGTNTFHGDAYWFGRYTALAAKDFFAPNRDFDPFVRNQFGYSVSGPIQTDKTFFFVNEEFQRFRTTLTEPATVPTGPFKTGNFTFDRVPVNVSTGSACDFGLSPDPTIQKILALYPRPNGKAVDDVRGIYFFPSKSDLTGDTVTGRVDHYFSSKEDLSVRYSFNRLKDSNLEHVDFLPGLGATQTNQRLQNLSLHLTSTLRSTLINDFRLGANRIRFPLTCGGVNVFDSFGPVDQFGRGMDYAFPGLSGFGCQFLGDTDSEVRYDGTYTAEDVIAWVHGRHVVKTGFEFHDIYSNSYNDFVSRALLDFSVFSNENLSAIPGLLVPGQPPCDKKTTEPACINLQNMVWMLLGAVDNQTQAQFFNHRGQRTPTDERGFRQHEFSGFVQDSFKILPNLTASYGVRYEFNGVPSEVHNLMSTLFANPGGPGPFTFTTVGTGDTLPQLYKNDWKDIEPRIGLAWDPFRHGKTSVRGGYGTFHDRVFGQLTSVARGVPPYQQILTCTAVNPLCPQFSTAFMGTPLPFALTTGLPFPPQHPFTPLVPNGSNIFFPFLIDPNLRLPYSQSWNFGVQHELLPTLLVEVNYVGTKGTRLLRIVDGNPPQPNRVAQLLPILVSEFEAQNPNLTPAMATLLANQTLQFTNLWLGVQPLGPLPFPAANNTAFVEPELIAGRAFSTYNSLQANITKRLSRGLQIQGAYTWSHAIDDASDPLVAAIDNQSFPRNSLNLKNEKGNSSFDVTQRLVMNYTWEIPLGRGHSHLAAGKLGKIFEGWQLAGITTFASGLPFDLFTNVDSEHTGQNARPDFNPAGKLVPPSFPQTGPNVGLFSDPPFGFPGNIGRNRFRGPGVNNWDMVLTKQVLFTERIGLDIRTEAYNLFNRVQFGQPANFLPNFGTFGQSLNEVGRADGTSGARQIQFGLKFHF